VPDEAVAVLKFLGFDLELFVDGILDDHDPVVHSAHDFQGSQWLIVQVDTDSEHLVWVCAPISARALRAVADRTATTTDALRHSLTGTVEVVTVDHGRAVPDRCLCCATLPDNLLPTPQPARPCAA
jgi:hypothetical protein